jgi:DNA-binding MarR family transcriptional regulator
MSSDALRALYERPGFMLRRAHQIAVSVFLEETAELRVTTTQYGILHLLQHRPKADQITIARLLGLDRSTTGMVVKTLVGAGFVDRVVDETDKRRRNLELTPAGETFLRRLEAPARSAVARLLSPLDLEERPAFLRMLKKLTAAFNETARVPLLSIEDRAEEQTKITKTPSEATR